MPMRHPGKQDAASGRQASATGPREACLGPSDFDPLRRGSQERRATCAPARASSAADGDWAVTNRGNRQALKVL